MKFIKLQMITKHEIYVNPNQICIIKPLLGGGTRITFPNGKEIEFIESVDEIMKKIKGADEK